MPKNPDIERTATGWRIPAALRKRLVSWARGEGRNVEDVASEWLDERLTKAERKKAAALLGKPNPKD